MNGRQFGLECAISVAFQMSTSNSAAFRKSTSVTINRRQSRKRQNLWLRESNCLDVRGDDFSPCFS